MSTNKQSPKHKYMKLNARECELSLVLWFVFFFNPLSLLSIPLFEARERTRADQPTKEDTINPSTLWFLCGYSRELVFHIENATRFHPPRLVSQPQTTLGSTAISRTRNKTPSTCLSMWVAFGNVCFIHVLYIRGWNAWYVRMRKRAGPKGWEKMRGRGRRTALALGCWFNLKNN